MAQNKVKSTWAAFIHATVYSFPFFYIGSWRAVLIIWASHLLIDRFRLARYVVWAKNHLAPRDTWYCDYADNDHDPNDQTGRCGSCHQVRMLPWKDCTATGYPPDVPVWLSVWLLIVADNTLHLAINYLALKF